MNSGTEVIRIAGGFIDPAVDTQGAREDLQMYYCFSDDKVQVFSKIEDHLGEATLTGQVNLADLDRLSPVKRVERVLSCEYEKKPVLVIVAANTEQHHVVFWFDIRSESLNRVVLEEPLEGHICSFHVMHSPMIVFTDEHDDTALRHVLAFGMQDGSIRIIMMEYPVKEYIQTTSTLVPASDLDGSPVTALTLIPPAKNKPAGSHFSYQPRLIAGTVKGLLVHLAVQRSSSIAVNPLHRVMVNLAYMDEPITQITGLRGSKRQSTCVIAVGQDSSLGKTADESGRNQACVNLIEYYGNNKRKCLFVLRPIALQDICEIMSLRLVPNTIGYSITIAFRSIKADSTNIVSYNIFKEEHTIKARLNLDAKEEDLGPLWDVYPLENKYLALTEKSLVKPSDSEIDVQDDRVILFRPDGTGSQEDMIYHSDDEQEFSRGTSIESTTDLDADESNTEPEMVDEVPASEQKKLNVEEDETEAILAEFEESYTVEAADHHMLEAETSTIKTSSVIATTTSGIETQDTDDELQKFEEASEELHDVLMNEANDTEEIDASVTELFTLEDDAEAAGTYTEEEIEGSSEHDDDAPQYSNNSKIHDDPQYDETPENSSAVEYDDNHGYDDHQDDDEMPNYDTYDDYQDYDEPVVPAESSDTPYTAGTDESILHGQTSVKEQGDADADAEQDLEADIGQSADIQQDAGPDIEQSKGPDIEHVKEPSDTHEDKGLLVEQTEESHIVDDQISHIAEDQEPHVEPNQEFQVKQDQESHTQQDQTAHVQQDEIQSLEQESQTAVYQSPHAQQDEEPQAEQVDMIAVDSYSNEPNKSFAHPEETTPQQDASRSFSSIDQVEQSQTAYVPSTAAPSLSTDEFQMWSSFVTATTTATTPSPKMTPSDSEHLSSSPLRPNEDSHTPFTSQDLLQSTGAPSLHGSVDDNEALVNHPIFDNYQTLVDQQLFENGQSLSGYQPFARGHSCVIEQPVAEEELLSEEKPFIEDQHITEDQRFTEDQAHARDEPRVEAQSPVEELSPIDNQPAPSLSLNSTDMLPQYPQTQACREQAVDGELFIDLLLREVDSEYTNSYPSSDDKLDVLLNETLLHKTHNTIACYLSLYDTGDDVIAESNIAIPEQEVNLAIVYWLLDRCLYERAVEYLKKPCASTAHDYKIMKTLERGLGCQNAQQILEEIESSQQSDFIFRPENWVRFLQDASLPAALTYIKTRVMNTDLSKEYISNIIHKLFHGSTAPTMLELKQLAMFEHGKDQHQQLLSFAQKSDTLPAKAFMVCHYIHTCQYGDAVLLNREIQAGKPAISVSEQEREIYRECQVLEERVYDSLPPIARELPAEIYLFPPGHARPPYENYFRDNGIHAGAKLFGDVLKSRMAKMEAEKRAREQEDEEGRECTKARKL